MSNSEFHNPAKILVRVWGMNAEGRPFFQNVMAGNLTSSGALLTGMEQTLKMEEVIGLQYETQKTRVRVVHVGDAVLPGRMQAEVEIVGGQPCPWADQVGSGEPPPEKTESSRVKNARRFPRLRAHFPFELRDERGAGSAMKTHAADISGRGCYVETLVPLPLGTPLSITFWIESDKIVTAGLVRSSDGGVGMGIEFTGLNDETKDRLQKHLEKQANETPGGENSP
jgi:PilZ domain